MSTHQLRRFHQPSPADQLHPCGASAFKRLRARFGRAWAGQNVIDQKHRLACNGSLVADAECTSEGLLRRWTRLIPFGGGVRRARFRASGSVPCLRDSSRATSADWLKPRPQRRVRCSPPAPGADRPLGPRAAPNNLPFCAQPRTFRPYLSHIIRGGRARHAPQVICPVDRGGIAQGSQPDSSRNSACFQQSGQKSCTSATGQPAQRGGKAK